jgi:uncharacterized protein
MMYMRFTWDPEKKDRNPFKHPGVTFELAEQVFEDPNHVILENYFFQEEREQRFQVIGMTGRLILIAVVFVERSAGGEEVIQIISARKATKYEEKIYRAASEA